MWRLWHWLFKKDFVRVINSRGSSKVYRIEKENNTTFIYVNNEKRYFKNFSVVDCFLIEWLTCKQEKYLK